MPWDTHPLKKRNFFLQILVLSYEQLISLPFFSHYPDNRTALHAQTERDWPINFRMQNMLALLASFVVPQGTLSGLCLDGKPRLGSLTTWQGEVCMVAPSLLDGLFFFSP